MAKRAPDGYFRGFEIRYSEPKPESNLGPFVSVGSRVKSVRTQVVLPQPVHAFKLSVESSISEYSTQADHHPIMIL
jgi:hypothetical protein